MAMLALSVAAAGPAAAQLGLTRNPRQHTNAPIVLRADEIEHNSDLGLTIARGHVEVSQNGDVLLADTVTYNQRTDTVTASGHVSLSQPTGEILFAEYLELRNAMSDGFAKNVRMLLADRSRLAANTARLTNDNRTELRRGVYSPCDLCKNDPSAPPAWQFDARQIDHDKEFKLIEIRDATMEIDGWPVFYTPYISMPDPSVKRASGFLTPSLGSSSTVGFHVAIPYFLVLGPDKDLTLAPRFTSKAGPVLGSEYRQALRRRHARRARQHQLQQCRTPTRDQSRSAARQHQRAQRVATSARPTAPGFDVQRVSDQTYLLRFGFGNPPLNAEISRAYRRGLRPALRRPTSTPTCSSR